MLKIQVLGKGLIPRGYGLAPRLNPFPADLVLIGTILSTPGLTVNYLNPDTNKMCPLTKDNLKRIYNNYGMKNNNNITLAPKKVVLTVPKEEVPVLQPPISLGNSLTPQQEVPVSPVNENNNEEKTEEKVEENTANSTSTEVADEKKDNQNNGSLKPINAPDNNHNNNQNKNQQFNKNGNNNKK